jgi:heme/copper-type cytochrome/quinol oxidase subunit 2
MRSWLKSAFVLMVILLLSTVFLAILYRPTNPVPIPEAPRVYYEVTISLSVITPERIEVAQGTRVFLNVTSTDVEHRFALEPYVVETVVPANETVQVGFLANLSGTFQLRCTIVAPGHVEEKAELVVTAS